MTSSQIMINTQIVIATAAARFSSARAALGQSDRSATSSYGDLLAAQGNVTGIPYAGINSEGKLICHNKPIRRIAVVGTGVIGASWAAEYLARGFDVVATDPAPNAESGLRKLIDEAWKDLTSIGLSKGASRDRLSFTTNMKEALSQADLVQENAPERPDFKIKLYAEMEEFAPVDTLLASSSSGITPSVIQSQANTRSVWSSDIHSIRRISSR